MVLFSDSSDSVEPTLPPPKAAYTNNGRIKGVRGRRSTIKDLGDMIPLDTKQLPQWEDLDPRHFKFNVTETQVYDVAIASYDFSSTVQKKFKDLPHFDDTKSCGIALNQQQDLLKIEVHRLVEAASSQAPLLFNGKDAFGAPTMESLRDISNLADQLQVNLGIIELENLTMVLEHSMSTRMIKLIAEEFVLAHGALKERYKDTDRIPSQEPETLKSPEVNREAYFSLVDFTTSTIARHLVRSAHSTAWYCHTLGVLALWSVKLKAISFDPGKYAENALSDSTEVVSEIVENILEEKKRELQTVTDDDATRKQHNCWRHVRLSDAESSSPIAYFLQGVQIRFSLAIIFRSAVQSLFSWDTKSLDEFEVCTLTYETGPGKALIVLHSGRNGSVHTSSYTPHVKFSHAALELATLNVNAIQERQKADSLRTSLQSLPSNDNPITVKWQLGNGHRGNMYENSLELTNADDLITILISLSLSSPANCSYVLEAISNIAGRVDVDEPIRHFAQPHLLVKFSVSTLKYLTKRDGTGGKHGSVWHDPEVIPVSQSPLGGRMNHNIDLRQKKIPWRSRPTLQLPVTISGEKASFQKSSKLSTASVDLEYYRIEVLKMESWVITESSITVNCKLYVMVVLGICGIILMGGIAIPFTVKGRVEGVDPFQMTTFTWLLTGTFLLLAKSRYVSEWAWHDFLRGQVVCKTTTDLASVTGIHHQMILTKLLHYEKTAILRTTGPYNGMFTRKAENQEGFSIDVPVQLSTLLASGFVILKVLSDEGEHLILLDARKDSLLDSAYTSERMVRYISCLDIRKKDVRDDGVNLKSKEKGAGKILFLTENHLRWNKVLGLYIQSQAKFG